MIPVMWIDDDSCYRALMAHDARFDGRFFVGVSSTGIYCRPVCTVRRPRRENCRFFRSAAAAEREGFRPCLRCRPELAPGHSSVDASSRLARAAAGKIEDGVLQEQDLAGLAADLGTSARHLRRVFAAEFGVTPVEYAQTQRLLLAKRLLTDTALPVTEIAMAAGFGSVRRFNALFRERYRLEPRTLRKTPEAAAHDALVFELAYRPPYAWRAHLAFLAPRTVAGVEILADGTYCRTVAVRSGGRLHRGWLAAGHDRGRGVLRIRLSASLSRAVPETLGRCKRLFDVTSRPDEIAGHLGTLAAETPGLRVPGAFDGFEMAVRAVLGQQITVAAARTLAGRLAAAFGAPIDTGIPGLDRTFPEPGRLAGADLDELGRLGVIRSRGRAILALARACAEGSIVLAPGADVERTMEALRALPGIGEWTTQYVAMRALAWPDAFPHTDHAVMKALSETSPRRVLDRAEPWRPWRAYAAMHLWHSLTNEEATP